MPVVPVNVGRSVLVRTATVSLLRCSAVQAGNPRPRHAPTRGENARERPGQQAAGRPSPYFPAHQSAFFSLGTTTHQSNYP